MVLVQTWLFFQLSFLGSIGQKYVFYNTIKRKNAYVGYKNKKFKKVEKLTFFHLVNAWFWCKNGHFCNLFFLANIGQEKVFYDILERKNFFLRYKNRKFNKSKNWHFSKGVNLWIWSKNGHFSNFSFLANISQKNVFYDILVR